MALRLELIKIVNNDKSIYINPYTHLHEIFMKLLRIFNLRFPNFQRLQNILLNLNST